MGVGLWGTTTGRILRVLAASGRVDFIRLFHSEDVVSLGIVDIKGRRLYLLNANGEQSAFVSSVYYGTPLQMAEDDPAIPSLDVMQGEDSIMVYGPDACKGNRKIGVAGYRLTEGT